MSDIVLNEAKKVEAPEIVLPNSVIGGFEKVEKESIIPQNYSIYIKTPDYVYSQRKIEGLKKLAEIKQWGIRNPTKFMSEFMGVELLDAQEYVFMNSWVKPFSLWLESRAAGKALALDTPIPTPDGLKTMGDIEVGDYVYSSDGVPVEVRYVSPIWSDHECYELEIGNEKIIADKDHIWQVTMPYGAVANLNTEDVYKTYKETDFGNHIYIDRVLNVDFPEKKIDYSMYHFASYIERFLKSEDVYPEGIIPEFCLYLSTQQRLEFFKVFLHFSAKKKKENFYLIPVETKDESVIRFLESLNIPYTVVVNFESKDRKFIKFEYDEIASNENAFDINKVKAPLISIKKVESVPVKCISVNSKDHLYLCGKTNIVTHNTTLLALFSMVKGLLFDNYRIYICSGTADQSQETFRKIEDIALKQINSMTGLTDVFKHEVEVSQANTTGFIHNPMGFTYNLYNHSFVKTLNSNVNKKRGKRCETVVFDEGGWLLEEDFNVIGAFTALKADFKLGGDIDVSALPKEFPHHLLYASSASSVDTAFYNKYKEFSMRMFLGDDRYFVGDINCDVVINATFKGKKYPVSLLSRENVDNEMRANPEKALREYYNRFTKDGGAGQIIKRASIVKNSFVRPPVLANDTKTRKFVLAYDPARSRDNSILGIAELRLDPEKGYMLDIVNVVSFVDTKLKNKTPMMYQDQIKKIRELLLDYNGLGVLDYENIEIFLADSGAGGGGNSWVRDSLIENWKSKDGVVHKGLIDKNYSPEYIKRYPDAVNKLRLLEPTRYKSEMFEALIKMVDANLITFTEKYDNKGYLNILETNTKLLEKSEKKIKEKLNTLGLSVDEYEERLSSELEKLNVSKVKTYKLNMEEEIALTQIDAMKEEIVNICRIKRDGGKDGFRLPANKDADTGVSEATMHDDRAYVLAMLGWYLSEKRLEHIKNKKAKTSDVLELASALPIRKPKRDTF